VKGGGGALSSRAMEEDVPVVAVLESSLSSCSVCLIGLLGQRSR
jgi:hypothetical protein